MFGAMAAMIGVGGAGTRAKATSGRRVPQMLDLTPPECRASEALCGNGSLDFAPQGSAFSAAGRQIQFSLGLAPLYAARWVLIWNPMGDPNAGVQLKALWLDDSPLVLETATPYEQPVISTPTTNSVRVGSVLAQLQAIQTRGVNTWIEQYVKGTAPIIFASYLELVWDEA